MTTLEDHLRDLAIKATELKEEAYSTHKDADDAESMFIDNLESEVEDTKLDIKLDMERFLGE